MKVVTLTAMSLRVHRCETRNITHVLFRNGLCERYSTQMGVKVAYVESVHADT